MVAAPIPLTDGEKQRGELALQKAVSFIVEDLHPTAVWLFGSRAEGRARPDSDYDLLVVLDDDAPKESFDLRRAWDLAWKAELPADVVPCTVSDFEGYKTAPDTLAGAAFQRGRKLYERARK